MSYKGNLLKVLFLGLLTLAGCKKDKNHHLEQSPVQTEMSHIGNVVLGGVTLEMYVDSSNIIYAKHDDKFYPITLKETEALSDSLGELMKREGYYEPSDWTIHALPVGDVPNDSLKNTNFVKEKVLRALENAGYGKFSPEDISVEVYRTEDDTLLTRELKEAIERSDTVPPPIVAASELFSYGGISALIKTSAVWNQLKPPKDGFEFEDDDFFGPLLVEKNGKNQKWSGAFYTANIKKDKWSRLSRSNLPR